jgi:hypothetical protein
VASVVEAVVAVAAVGTTAGDGDPKMEVMTSETGLYRPFISLNHLMQRKWEHMSCEEDFVL